MISLSCLEAATNHEDSIGNLFRNRACRIICTSGAPVGYAERPIIFMSVRRIPGLAALYVAWQSCEGQNEHQTGYASSHPSQSERTAGLPIHDSKIAQ